jgi:hypothetical protein
LSCKKGKRAQFLSIIKDELGILNYILGLALGPDLNFRRNHILEEEGY